MPKSSGTIAEVLKQNGYNTAWFGKNHNVPDWQSSQAGPFDLWPTGLGFEYFYGFIGGDTDQWHSAIFEGTKPIEAEEQSGSNPIHFDELMADKAIDWIRLQNAMAPDKPFFVYYTTGTAHAPHHAPKDWIAKFKGQFDQGWDKVREETLARQIAMGIVPEGTKLTPRPTEIPAWDSLERRSEAALCAHDGDLRRPPWPTRTTRSAGSSTPSRQPANSITPSSSSSRATTAPVQRARCKVRPTKSASTRTV